MKVDLQINRGNIYSDLVLYIFNKFNYNYMDVIKALVNNEDIYVSYDGSDYLLVDREELRNYLRKIVLKEGLIKDNIVLDILNFLNDFIDSDGVCDFDSCCKLKREDLFVFPMSDEWNVNKSITDILDNDIVFNSLTDDVDKVIYIYLFLCFKLIFDKQYTLNDEYKIRCSAETLEGIETEGNNNIVCFSFSIILYLLIKRYCPHVQCSVISYDSIHYYLALCENDVVLDFDGTIGQLRDLDLVKLGVMPKHISSFFSYVPILNERIQDIFNMFCESYGIIQMPLGDLLRIINFEFTDEESLDPSVIEYLKNLDYDEMLGLSDWFSQNEGISFNIGINRERCLIEKDGKFAYIYFYDGVVSRQPKL